jgi:hypothetical protein
MAPSCESTFLCQNFFTGYVGVVLHGLSSHVLLYLLHGHGASLQFFTCSPLIVNFCGGSLWFFTCSSLLVTWAWCFFAVLHMLSFNCKFLLWFFTCSSLLVTWTWCFFAVLHMLSFNCTWVQWFFVVLHMLSFNCTWVCSSCGYWWFFTCSTSSLCTIHGCGSLWFFTCSSSSLLLPRCGSFVPLHMIFFTCTWVWLFCGSSDDLLLYLYMDVVVLRFFTWSSSLLAHGCYDDQFWHPAEIKPDIDSFLPLVEQQNKIVLLLKWFLLLLHTQLATSTTNNKKIPSLLQPVSLC